MPSLREEITRTLVRFTRRGESSFLPGKNRKSASPPDQRDATQFGVYRIIRQLGKGGMGRVYLALDTRLGRHVALKFLPAEFTSDPELLQRFQQEARAASALNHPHIVTIYDFVEIEGEFVLVSEFIDGITLRTLLDRGRLPVESALQIASEVTAALNAAHTAGIIHRDLKPSNIMLRSDGYAKVIDFGLAKFTGRKGRNSADGLTQRGTVVGTVDYMSPEQARGEELDTRTDIWSLGVVLYELVTGVRPFQGATDSHVIVNILDTAVPPMSPGEAPPTGLTDVLKRALMKGRNERYQTARELLTDLQQVQRGAGLALESRPVVAAGKARRRALWLMVGALACLILAGAILWWSLNAQDRIWGPHWFQLQASRPLTFSGDVYRATVSPNGKSLVYTSGSDIRQVLHEVELGSGRDRVLAADPAKYVGLTFSPDGKQLYTVVGDDNDVGRLFTRSLEQGEAGAHLLLEHVDGPVVFSPSGSQFAFMRVVRDSEHSANEIWVASFPGPTRLKRIVSLPATQITAQLAWSKRENTITAVTYRLANATSQATVMQFGMDGHEVRALQPREVRNLSLPVAIDDGVLLAFSGTPTGALQKHLVQLHVPTGTFHETSTDVVGFDSISATADSQTLASVRVDQRAAIWTVGAGWHPGGTSAAPQRVTRDSEYIRQITWDGHGNLVFPSARSGNVNLARLLRQGGVEPLGSRAPCVESYPETATGHNVLVYASNCAHGGDDFNLWTMDLTSGRKQQITEGTSYQYQPSPSPDGQWVVYTAWHSNLSSVWKVPLAGGEPVRLSAVQGRLPFVSPDGERVVCQLREPRQKWMTAILRMSDGKVLERFSDLPASTAPLVRWSPDGKSLDFIRAGESVWSIWRRPLEGRNPTQLTPETEEPITYFAWNEVGSSLAYIVERQQRDVVLFTRGPRAH